MKWIVCVFVHVYKSEILRPLLWLRERAHMPMFIVRVPLFDY